MKTAILFIHGFMGSRAQFEGLEARLLNSGADLYTHILPGHESGLREFRGSNAASWQESVSGRLSALVMEYERVIPVGHSMGGLLAVKAAAEHPDKVAGIVTIAFPLAISPGRSWLGLMTEAYKPAKAGEDPRITAARKLAGVPVRGIGESFSTLPQNVEFLKTVSRAKAALPGIKAPLVVLNFRNDEIVSPRVPGMVKRLVPASVYILPESYHFLFDEKEEDFMAQKIRELV
jgi:carboxylesterase